MEELEKLKAQLPYYNLFAGAVVALTAILAIAVLFPIVMVDNLDKASKLSEILKNNIVVLGGGITGVVGLALAYMRVTAATRQANAALDQAKAATDQAKAATDQAKAAADQALTASQNYANVATRERETRLTSLLTTALEQLGNLNPSVRIGGILALERIAKESPDYYEYAFSILSSHLRHVRPWPSPDPTLPLVASVGVEVEIIIEVIKRRQIPESATEPLNLTGCDFTGISLRGEWRQVDFSNSNFQGTTVIAKFQSCRFRAALLQSAAFVYCTISSCELFDANCTNTNFLNSEFERTDFTIVDFEKAFLESAKFNDCALEWAQNLTQAQLDKAAEVINCTLPKGLTKPGD